MLSTQGISLARTELGISAAALFLITTCSVSSTRCLVRRFVNPGKLPDHQKAERYQDEDGIATEESERKYSFHLQRVLIVLLSGGGLLDSLALLIIATQSNSVIVPWLDLIAWLFLVIQAGSISFESDYLTRFRQSAFGALCSLVLFLTKLASTLLLWPHDDQPILANTRLSLNALQLASALGLAITCSTVPRRPDVYRDGKVVDRQCTASMLGRLAFSWSTPILQFATTNNGLEIEHLPAMDHNTRTTSLRERFDQAGPMIKLWRSLLWSHKAAFISQCILATVASVTTFLPRIALYFILQALEARDSGEVSAFGLWTWVLVLGLSIAVSAWMEAWLFFVSYLRLGQPIFQQLTAVVFRKAMCRMDIKSVSDTMPVSANETLLVDEESGIKADCPISAIEEEDGEPKTHQSTINLVGVDSYRVSSFAAHFYIFADTFTKLILACCFLVKLIGWIPLCAGLAVFVLVLPVNTLTSKSYARSQQDLMKFRDRKMTVMTEALQGIRQIKFSAFEEKWQHKILEVRKKELRAQWRSFKLDNILIAIWILGPVMLSAVAIGTYAIIHGWLSPSIAFTTISVFEVLETTLSVAPQLVSMYLDASVSAQRIETYLNSAEKGQYIKKGSTISFQNADVAWPAETGQMEENQFLLRRLNLSFPNNELSIISGKTGSGKSLLLASILGEASLKSGMIEVPSLSQCAKGHSDDQLDASNWCLEGSIAFVSQISWIENASIKDNVLFGLPFNPSRYQETVSVCALQKDLEMLPDGDLTEIGTNGVNLSGGQKWRVSFARALYSRASILILDDIFSAVDVNVGRQLFEEALLGDLSRGRTRILVTHHTALCVPKAKYFVLLGGGGVLHAGTIDELRKSGYLKAILAQDIEEQKRFTKRKAQSQSTTEICDSEDLKHVTIPILEEHPRESSAMKLDDTISEVAKVPKKFMQEEERERGAIKLKVYAEYIRASGGLSRWVLILMAFAACLIVALGRSWWVSIWTRSYWTNAASALNLFGPLKSLRLLRNQVKAVQVDENFWFYLSVYFMWCVGMSVIGALRYFLTFVGSIRASKHLFQKLTYRVLRAPLRWLDTVPMGRILNRFTTDFNMIDSHISIDLAFMLHNIMQVMSVIVVSIFVSSWMIGFSILLLAICIHYALRYIRGAREVKRIESNCKSPIFESFGAAVMGISTIRAFDKTELYVQKIHCEIDIYARAYWHLWLFNCWMSFRLNTVGAIFTTIIAVLIVSVRAIDASLAGFALSFALEYTVALIWILRQYANVELDMNAVERVIEYSNISIENQNGISPPAAWPTTGNLEVKDLTVSYAPDLPPVLQELSFTVKGNQRVGVVGRTGAGKSSLALALFRCLEVRAGTILVDGLDISKLRLQDVRSRLTIIPQDPILFSGTVRSNLDAFNQYTDIELRDALKRVHLISDTTKNDSCSVPTPPDLLTTSKSSSTNIHLHLYSPISESGLNLSQGQRQLLCLARAIVHQPKILVLDEATSAVDMETDVLIQQSTREEFKDCTLIVVAHRLSTIADFDRVLVLGEGRKVEWGTPRELMDRGACDGTRECGRKCDQERHEGVEDREGVFRKMVEESGERETLKRIIFGKGRGGGAVNATTATVRSSSWQSHFNEQR